LLLADLSGFTAFLAQTELEHAHDVIGELLQLLVEHLQPALAIAEVEGDAVFAYAAAGSQPRGEALLDLIDSTYGHFLGRVEAIRRHTTCTCSACRAIPTLDLKFIVHYGPFILQSIAGASKPLGSDVNLAHRLLKNHIGESTGWRAYALLTGPAVQSLGIDTSSMLAAEERYPDLPAVKTFSYDLRQRWQQIRRDQAVLVTEDESDLTLTVDLPVPPAGAWAWLNEPKRRARWVGMGVDRVLSPSGRGGPGAVTHCVHGQKVESVHTILDWQPFDYFTEEIGRPSDGKPQALNSIVFEPIPGGTRIHSRYRVLVRPRAISTAVFRRSSAAGIRSSLESLRRLAAEEASPRSPLVDAEAHSSGPDGETPEL
jgi:uncharacterized protein YndB with AHSA1/START domain